MPAVTDAAHSALDRLAIASTLAAQIADLRRLEAAVGNPSLADRAVQPVLRWAGRQTLAQRTAEAATQLRASYDSTLDRALELSLPHKPQMLAQLRHQQGWLNDLAMGAKALAGMETEAAAIAGYARDIRSQTHYAVATVAAGAAMGGMAPGLLAAPAILELHAWRDIGRALHAVDRLLLRGAAPQALPAMAAVNGGTAPDFLPVADAARVLRTEYEAGSRRNIAHATDMLDALVAALAPAVQVLPRATAALEGEVRHISSRLHGRQIHVVHSGAMRGEGPAHRLVRDLEAAHAQLGVSAPLPGCGVLELTHVVSAPKRPAPVRPS